MKIIITGAGAVGYHLAKLMASESKDIYLIDENEDRLQYVASHIDVFTICGDAKSMDILMDAKKNMNLCFIRKTVFILNINA